MMWNDPRGREAARRQCTAGLTAIDKWGDDIWEIMCFRHEGFTKYDIETAFAKHADVTINTAHNYVQAFWAYAKAAADTFNGPASRLERVDRHQYHLVNGANMQDFE